MMRRRRAVHGVREMDDDVMKQGARRIWTVLGASFIACALPVLSAGQEVRVSRPVNSLATSLAQAESAFDQGDVVTAARGYAAVLAVDPTHPRALFRLAQLRRDDSDTATTLLQKYVGIVPSDAWGHLALADAFARGGQADRALRAYGEALAQAPQDRDIRLGRPRLLERMGRTDAAIGAYEAWLAESPADGEALRELAVARQRAGRSQGAARALERAQELAPNDTDLARRIDALRVRTAPALEVGFIGGGETGASTSGASVGAEFPAGDAGRFGVHYQRRRVASFGDAAQTQRFGFSASGRPRSNIQLNLNGGAMWGPSLGDAEASGLHPDVAFRVRRSSAGQGPILLVKAQRDSIAVTPDLVRAPVSRTQVVTSVDVPVGGPWRIRGQTRVAALTRGDERNRRTGVTAGMGVAIAPEVRLSSQWHQTRNGNPTARGYFAPAIAEVAEIGLELEREYDRATIALDAGGGLQRIQRANQPMGSWAPTLRAWGLVAWNMGMRQQLLLEFESYDSQVSDAVIVTDRWRYASVTMSFRFALR